MKQIFCVSPQLKFIHAAAIVVSIFLSFSTVYGDEGNQSGRMVCDETCRP